MKTKHLVKMPIKFCANSRKWSGIYMVPHSGPINKLSKRLFPRWEERIIKLTLMHIHLETNMDKRYTPKI